MLVVLSTASLCTVAQDRIYKKNGLIVFAEVKSVSDSAIVFSDEQGERSIRPETVSAIRYSLGNVLPVSGSIARRYRDDALVYHRFASNKKVNLAFDAFSATLQVGYEHFLDPSLHQSLNLQIGVGVGRNRVLPGYSDLGLVPFITNLGYRRYTSILRDVRFFYGATFQVSVVKSRFYTPYYSSNIDNSYIGKKPIVGVGPIVGMQLMVAKQLGVSLSTAPLYIFSNPVYSGSSDVSMQTHVGFTYYLPKK